ncbi:hypothetical protein ADIS_4743 [Lunatimonas lonarensis]|uniref:Uncharacterized protein n=1 Tax=Lunatimonas lonarensis TaxID=1232681 RepID=R7ZL20_9BACT|nr:hypothetical protein ADIS_4743 [Lunatimonas lonarensis]
MVDIGFGVKRLFGFRKVLKGFDGYSLILDIYRYCIGFQGFI